LRLVGRYVLVKALNNLRRRLIANGSVYKVIISCLDDWPTQCTRVAEEYDSGLVSSQNRLVGGLC